MEQSGRKFEGFSLIEILVVVVVIGVIAAIAIPRFSRGSAAVADSNLTGNLAVLKNAIELYANEHNGAFPGLKTFETQLTQYTDVYGEASTTKDASHAYGPYLRKVPTLPVGGVGYKNTNTLVDGTSGAPGATAGGWWYNRNTGDIRANLPDTERDPSGRAYNAY